MKTVTSEPSSALATQPSGAMTSTPQPAEPADIFAVIARAAADPSVDLAKMQGLIALRNDELKRIAEIEFNQAMTAAQTVAPMVIKRGDNPSTNSKYARLEHIKIALAPVLTKYGFALMFSEGDSGSPSKIRVLCDILHRGGHKEQRKMDLTVDDTGPKGLANKTKIHGEASAFTYGCRYMTAAIFNIIIIGDDKDGVNSRPKPANPAASSEDMRLKELAKQLWEVLKPVRGTEASWSQSNIWLWREDILDAAANETAPKLTEKQFIAAIEKATAKLK
jgi:hypothetical protein